MTHDPIIGRIELSMSSNKWPHEIATENSASLQARIRDLQSQLAAKDAAIDRLRAALRRHGKHGPDCKWEQKNAESFRDSYWECVECHCELAALLGGAERCAAR